MDLPTSLPLEESIIPRGFWLDLSSVCTLKLEWLLFYSFALVEYVIRRRNFRWWSKFNYVLSAGLDSGTILAVVFIFLTLQLPFSNGGVNLVWWGNTVFTNSEFFPFHSLLQVSNEFPRHGWKTRDTSTSGTRRVV